MLQDVDKVSTLIGGRVSTNRGSFSFRVKKFAHMQCATDPLCLIVECGDAMVGEKSPLRSFALKKGEQKAQKLREPVNDN
jgi:hypothetical protein